MSQKNLSTPAFGPRRQVSCDGYSDSPANKLRSAKNPTPGNDSRNWYPLDSKRPFFWRTGAAFADFSGDGLVDVVTHAGATRHATLFTQYRDTTGALRLKSDGQLQLTDGRPIDDRIVNRQAHWTESFRSTDWDGDGRIDLVYSCAGSSSSNIQDGGSIYLLRNVGTKTRPVFDPPRTLCCYGEPIRVTLHGPHPAVADIDGDGRPDILACVEWSVFPFYCHSAIEMDAHPEYLLGPVNHLGE